MKTLKRRVRILLFILMNVFTCCFPHGPELGACQTFSDLGNLQTCFHIKPCRLQGDSDPHWQCLINQTLLSYSPVISFKCSTSLYSDIGEIFIIYSRCCFPLKRNNKTRSGRKWGRSGDGSMDTCTEGLWGFKSCKQNSSV